MRLFILASCVLAALFLCGCATRTPNVVTWNRDSQPSIQAFHREVVPLTNLNYSLCELNRGLLFYNNGDFLHSDSRFANALGVMDRIREDKGQETAAVVWDERAKTFKGEPYERAMAYFCRGLCHFNTGDYSGALAAFRSSLAADAETRNKEARFLEDFTISHFMAALCYSRLGEAENAEAALRLARATNPDHPFLTPASLQHNFIAVIGLGPGPYKVGARKWAPVKAMEERISLCVDNRPAEHEPAEAVDLLIQARSQKWGEADSARVARQVGKAVLSGILSGLAGTNVNMEDYEDTRCWYGLPLKFYIFTAAVPPGNHTISLKAYDGKGNELERYGQTWFDVPIPAGQGPVLCLRSIGNLQNCHGLQMVKIEPQDQQGAKVDDQGETK